MKTSFKRQSGKADLLRSASDVSGAAFRANSRRYHQATIVTIAWILSSCTLKDDEFYVYRCWPCRSEKHVRRDSGKETIIPSKLSGWYHTRNPQHQHKWWYAVRLSDSGIMNAPNGCPMYSLTADEQEVFVRAASLERLREF